MFNYWPVLTYNQFKYDKCIASIKIVLKLRNLITQTTKIFILFFLTLLDQ